MNTQAHAVVNLAVLGRPQSTARENWAIVLGSVLPDLQIIAFYVAEKALYGTSEAEIWGRRYFEVHEYFDWMNSIPLTGLGVFIAHRLDRPVWRGFFGGLVLHCVVDLFTHNDDAHRHFLPLYGGRWESPVSYWDPAHFGMQFSVLETLVVIGCCYVLWRRYQSRLAAAGIGGVGLVYAALWIAIALWWSGLIG